MDNSKKFQLMLDRAISAEYQNFKDFDRTKNVQDQLQEMLEERKVTYFLIEEFSDFICNNLLEDHGDVPYTPSFKKEWEKASMEMLWLAFVMWERFSKRWDNEKEEWRKEK